MTVRIIRKKYILSSMKDKDLVLTPPPSGGGVLVGSLLGDCHLEKQNSEGDGGANAPYGHRLKFQQSEFHKDYVLHLYEIFKNLVTTPPKSRIRVGFGKEQSTWYFSTFAHPVFSYYGELFYRDRVKMAPKDLSNLLTPRGLAYWYMDDGGLKSHQSKGVLLHTHSFSMDEVVFLCEVLMSKWQLSCKPRAQKDGIQIYISGHSYETLRELIYPYLTPGMYYKFPTERKRRKV
jgi:hypothetical protein